MIKSQITKVDYENQDFLNSENESDIEYIE
jgi:hypothetical protein